MGRQETVLPHMICFGKWKGNIVFLPYIIGKKMKTEELFVHALRRNIFVMTSKGIDQMMLNTGVAFTGLTAAL